MTSDEQKSLDDILAQIKQDSEPVPPMDSAGAIGVGGVKPLSSAGVGHIDTHLSIKPSAAPITYVPETSTTNLTEDPSSAAHTLSSGLTERQRSLPKLDFRMMGGIVAMLMLVVGIGAATLLTQQPQDIRQRAFEQTAPVTAQPGEIRSEDIRRTLPADTTQVQVEQPRDEGRIFNFIFGAIALIAFILVAAFLFWTFIV